MDFVADELFDGRKLRMLTMVHCYTRECLAIDVGQNLKGEDVVNTLNRITWERGAPRTIKIHNGSEFISKVMDEWAYERGVELDVGRSPASRQTTHRWRVPTGASLLVQAKVRHELLPLSDLARKKLVELLGRHVHVLRRIGTETFPDRRVGFCSSKSL